MTGTFIWK